MGRRDFKQSKANSMCEGINEFFFIHSLLTFSLSVYVCVLVPENGSNECECGVRIGGWEAGERHTHTHTVSLSHTQGRGTQRETERGRDKTHSHRHRHTISYLLELHRVDMAREYSAE